MVYISVGARNFDNQRIARSEGESEERFSKKDGLLKIRSPPRLLVDTSSSPPNSPFLRFFELVLTAAHSPNVRTHYSSVHELSIVSR